MKQKILITAMLIASNTLIAAPLYSIEPLGTLGGFYSSAKSINDQGQVVGHSETALGKQKAFISTMVNGHRVMTNLGSLLNDDSNPRGHSSAIAINNSGQIVGYSEANYSEGSYFNPSYPQETLKHAFFIEKINDSWVMTNIHPDTNYVTGSSVIKSSPANNSSATDINDSGQVVIHRGRSADTAEIVTALKNDETWAFSTLEQDIAVPSFVYSTVFIDNGGQISFSREGWSNPGAVLSYSNGDWHRSNDISDCHIGGINNNNQLVCQNKLFIANKDEQNNWVASSFSDMDGSSLDINDSGIIVGRNYSSDSAFVYLDGEMHSLMDLINNGLEGWTNLSKATGINSSGQIVGNGRYKGKNMAFIMTPISESLANCEVGVSPKVIKKGEGTALWWWSEDASSGTISNGVGSIEMPTNYQWIHPTETTNYRMTVTGNDGLTSQCHVKVIVEGTCELGVDPQVINKGEGTALWWWTENVDSIYIRRPTITELAYYLPITEVSNGNNSTGYKWLYPSKTTTYKMNAKTKATALEDYEEESVASLLARGTATSCETTVIVNE